MKKLLALASALVMVLSLSACKNGESEENPTRFSDYNYEARSYKSIDDSFSGIVYKNRYYSMGCNNNCILVELPLPSDSGAMNKDGERAVCADPMCPHFGPEGMQCPAYMRDPQAHYLLDATESDGEAPIFYYSRCTADEIVIDEAWDAGQEYEIVRYDSAENATEQVASVNYPIEQLMTYGDRVYFVTRTASDGYEVHSVKKSGGKITTQKLGEGPICLIGANDSGVYVNDSKGNVYSLDLKFKDQQLIYTVAEAYPLQEEAPADLNMFIEGEHLYFLADFSVESVPYGNVSLDLVKTNVRRVKLGDPVGEGETVASDVYQNAVYGVYDGVLYYGPFDVTVDFTQHCPVSSSGGRICSVNLETLEQTEVITDCGLNFPKPCYVNDRCIIFAASPYRDVQGISAVDSGIYPYLLDLETGAIYDTQTAAMLYSGTAK